LLAYTYIVPIVDDEDDPAAERVTLVEVVPFAST
jgi:hypothetical protein